MFSCYNSIHFFFFQLLTSDFGLVVRWNGANNAQVDIPFTYWNRTCGLCGTFDDDPNNDFVTPDKLLVSISVIVNC